MRALRFDAGHRRHRGKRTSAPCSPASPAGRSGAAIGAARHRAGGRVSLRVGAGVGGERGLRPASGAHEVSSMTVTPDRWPQVDAFPGPYACRLQ